MYTDQLKGWQPELEAQKEDVEEELGAQTPEPGCTLGVTLGKLLTFTICHCVTGNKISASQDY